MLGQADEKGALGSRRGCSGYWFCKAAGLTAGRSLLRGGFLLSRLPGTEEQPGISERTVAMAGQPASPGTFCSDSGKLFPRQNVVPWPLSPTAVCVLYWSFCQTGSEILALPGHGF